MCCTQATSESYSSSVFLIIASYRGCQHSRAFDNKGLWGRNFRKFRGGVGRESKMVRELRGNKVTRHK